MKFIKEKCTSIYQKMHMTSNKSILTPVNEIIINSR